MTQSIERGRAESPSTESLFNRNFVLVCLISLVHYLAFQFLLPTLPLYMKGLGAQDTEIGLIFGIYSLSVLAARFIAGWALEAWGGKWLLVAGAFLYLLAMLLYNFAGTVSFILALRLFHGLGFGLVTTACWALAAELAPAARRGEALGYFGNFSSVAMALGPGIGLWLITAPGLALEGFPLLFAACAAASVLEMLLAFFVGETRHRPGKQPASSPGRAAGGWLSRDAMPFAIAMLAGSFAMGAIFSFVPVHLSTESAGNVSIFFFTYAAVTMLSRPFIGIFSDRIERRLVTVPLMAVCAVGVAILGISAGLPAVLASAVVCGIGFGSLQPTLLALVVENTKPRERGAALATFMSAIDVGIAVGSTGLGFVAQAAGYSSVFLAAGAAVVVGLAYFFFYQRSLAARRTIPLS